MPVEPDERTLQGGVAADGLSPHPPHRDLPVLADAEFPGEFLGERLQAAKFQSGAEEI